MTEKPHASPAPTAAAGQHYSFVEYDPESGNRNARHRAGHDKNCGNENPVLRRLRHALVVFYSRLM
jgi:hypothetical protein